MKARIRLITKKTPRPQNPCYRVHHGPHPSFVLCRQWKWKKDKENNRKKKSSASVSYYGYPDHAMLLLLAVKGRSAI
jgi:hypothetical protein